MTLPIEGVRIPITIVDVVGNPVAQIFDGVVWRLAVDIGGGAAPGGTLLSPPDTVVGIGATVALPAPPLGTKRMTVQVTGGGLFTQIRVREVGGFAGAGRLLTLLASTMYGGEGGAISPLEVQNVVGPAAAVHIDFEV